MTIEGEDVKAEINMGNDNQKDKIIIDSLDNVKKKLTIENFGKKDKLFINTYDFFSQTEKYGYKALKKLDGSLGNIEISFQDDEANTNTNPSVVSGFDFL